MAYAVATMEAGAVLADITSATVALVVVATIVAAVAAPGGCCHCCNNGFFHGCYESCYY
jgi:H+/gluconate symporter-like permease